MLSRQLLLSPPPGPCCPHGLTTGCDNYARVPSVREATPLSLQRSAEASRRRKAEPFRSAMSMLNFYINRGGRNLSAARRRCLEAAKDELRALYGRPPGKP